MQTLDHLVQTREKANALYRAGLDSGLTDAEYDTIEAAIRNLAPSHPTLTKGRDDAGVYDGEHYEERRLTMHMGSQQKALQWDDTSSYFRDTEEENADVYHASYKVDGMTSEVTYRDGKLIQVLTGGDGTTGRVITEQAILIKDLPLHIDMPGTICVRGEIHMTQEDFQAANEHLAKQGRDKLNAARNAAVGIIRSLKNKDLTPFLSFKAFDILVVK